MATARPKSTGQVQAIFGTAKQRGLDSDALREVVLSVLADGRRALVGENKTGVSILTYAEAERVIQRLKGQSFVPRRTMQWRRKKAGVRQLIQQSQLELIAELAAQRNWTAQSLTDFCQRQIKRDKPVTTAQANSVIEALKAMNRRDDLWAA